MYFRDINTFATGLIGLYNLSACVVCRPQVLYSYNRSAGNSSDRGVNDIYKRRKEADLMFENVCKLGGDVRCRIDKRKRGACNAVLLIRREGRAV